MLLTQTKLAHVMLPCPVVCILLLWSPWLSAGAALLERDFGDWKSSERVVRTMFGKLRGRVVLPQARLHEVALQPVEVFLGIPYASPPVGSLRFLPPMTAAHWDGVREADHFGPNCPQAPPDAPPHWSRQRPYTEEDERDKLQHHSLNRTWSPWPQMAEFLQDNQSEDCLYLNIFAPASVSRTEHSKLPVLIVSAASSLEWGGASLLDATALAAAAHVIVVTFNFRLGVLGFFPAMEEASRSNNALLDQVAALHWIQRNVDNFGGDRSRVTLLGHGKAAGLVHLLAMYPLAKDLFRSVALMSGSALSPWALCQSSNADYFAVQLAERLGCPTQPSAMVECLRHKSADELVELSRFPNEVPDYLCGPFGPIVDNSVITSAGVRAATSQGPFTEHDLLCTVTGTEALSMFNAEERRNGIETSLKDRLIRTLVRNTFDYHQQEIYLTVANEYTDWTRSVQTKKNALADTVASLSDGTVVGPVMETAVSHAGAAQQSRSGASTHLLVLSQPECPSASNSQREAPNCDAYPEVIPKDLLHLLGIPLRSSQSLLYPEFSRQDVQLSQTLIHYLKNYLRDGNPNGPSRPPSSHHPTRSKEKEEFISWPQFEPIHKMHLMFTDGKARTGSHWNAHRLSIWNRLLPALHRPPSRTVNHLSAAQLKAHQLHQLLEDSDKASSFAGNVRNMTFFAARSEPSLEAPTTALAPTVKLLSNDSRRVNGGVGATPPEPVLEISTSSLNALAVLTNGPYSRPLLTVLTVGCSLLVVNLLIFVGTFCQHRERSKPKQQVKETTDASGASKVSIKEEDACLQKTILQKDAAMLFLQEAAGHNLNQHQTTTDLFEATLSSDPNLGNAMETCYLYQLPSTFVASTVQRSRPRIPEGEFQESLTSLPNVVPTGVSIAGLSNGSTQQEPDIAVSSSSATTTSGITITSVTLARDPLNQQFDPLSQQSSAGLRDNGAGNGGARSSFKGGEETTV